jgi:Lrp/AsnC family transcriptional regulator for asnA, asnC and gidA
LIIDEIDKHILESLLTNARNKMIDIAKENQVSVTTIKNRIERLKKKGIIVDSALIMSPSYLGYPYPVSIGINMGPDYEEQIFEAIGKRAKIFGIDHFIGTFDVHVIAYAKTLEDIQEIKKAIQKHKGVNDVKMLVWTKPHFIFRNFNLETSEV